MYCYNCGKKVSDTDRFCPYCGTKLYNVTYGEKVDNGNFSEPRSEIVVQDEPARNSSPSPDYKELHTGRTVKTKSFPGDYYFCGKPNEKGSTLPLLAPVAVDVEDAYRNGVRGLKSWEGMFCFRIAETPEYVFYKYRCHEDGSGGCNIRQSKLNPRETVFFGKAKMYGCVFHDYLIQVDKSAYGDELYVYAKEIHTGEEKIYQWLGKYSIATGRGSRYDQDHVINLSVDSSSNMIVLDVNRTKCQNITNPDEEDRLTNIDTDYKLMISYRDGDFHAEAQYSTNLRQIFDNIYTNIQEEKPEKPVFAELAAALRASDSAWAQKSEIEKVLAQYGSKKGNQFLSTFATYYLKIVPKAKGVGERQASKTIDRFIANIKMKYGMPFLLEYNKFYKENSQNTKLLAELMKATDRYIDKTLLI